MDPRASVRRSEAGLALLLVVAGACGRSRYAAAVDAGAVPMDAASDDALSVDAAPMDAPSLDALAPDAPSSDAPMPSDAAPDALPDVVSGDARPSDAPAPTGDTDGPLADCFISVGCAVLCEIDPVAESSTCGGPVSGLAWSGMGRGTALIDMTGHTTLDVEVTACDPTGWSFVLADSPGTDGFGGDTGQFSNDAELEVWNRRAIVNFSDHRPMPTPTSREIGRVLSVAGCSTHVISVSDARVSECSGGEYVGMDSLRIAPPRDDEGPPDALWCLGIQQTMSGRPDRVGTGVTRLRLCFR